MELRTVVINCYSYYFETQLNIKQILKTFVIISVHIFKKYYIGNYI